MKNDVTVEPITVEDEVLDSVVGGQVLPPLHLVME